MSTTWWFERVRDTNAFALFVDEIDRGEIEYIFANPEGNKEIDVKVKDVEATLLVSIKEFDCRRNSFCKLFKHACGDAENFCNVWFQKRTEGRSEEDSDSDEDSGNQATRGSGVSATDGDKDDDMLLTSICHFEEEINKKRIGMFMIPTKCMIGPSEGRGVRNLDDSYVKVLEERIRNAPRAIVAPLVANIQLSDDDAFDENKMDCYTFEMIGGNHSRTVLQKLIEEPMMRLEASLHHRLAIIYKNLTNEEALSIGKMHNLAGETHLCTKFQDDAKMTRRLFLMTAEVKEDELLPYTDQMRDTFLKVFNLTAMDKKERKKAVDAHGTTRLIARMSGRCWKMVEKIFKLYEEGKIKGQRKERAGQLGLPDCKKSYWQFLHNLNDDQQFSLLCDLSACSISFPEAAKKAAAIKQEERVLQALEEVYNQPREALPKVLTAQKSIEQLNKEVTPRKRAISEEFKRRCQALLDGEEMEETEEPGEEEDFRKELRLARKRIQELEEENRDLKAKLQKLNS